MSGRVDFPGKPPGIEDEVVALRAAVLEFHFGATVHPVDPEHLRVDVARARAFVQQVRHPVRGQVVGVRDLLWREVVGEVPIAPPPTLEGDAVLAGALQALLNGFVGQRRQLLQMLNQAGPTAFTDPDDRNARVIDVVQLVAAVGVKTCHGGSRQRPRGSSPDDCDSPQRSVSRLDHLL